MTGAGPRDVNGAAETGAFRLRLNDPPEFTTLEALPGLERDINLVWPGATFPLDKEMWLGWMDRQPDSRSFYVELEGETVGHAAIFGARDTGRAHIAWLYLVPAVRGEGRGQQFIGAVEAEARSRPGIDRISLRTNSFNPRALHIYTKRGYQVTGTEGETIEMIRDLT